MKSVTRQVLSLVSDSVTGFTYGQGFDVSQYDRGSAQIVFAGTPVGVFSLQGSNDTPAQYTAYQNTETSFGPRLMTPVPTNWTPLSLTVNCSGGVSEFLVLNPVTTKFIRAVWDYTSGGSAAAITVNLYTQGSGSNG